MWSGNEVINKIIVNALSAFITLAVGAIAWFSKDTVLELRNVQIQQAGMTVQLLETNNNLERTNAVLEKQEIKGSVIVASGSNKGAEVEVLYVEPFVNPTCIQDSGTANSGAKRAAKELRHSQELGLA